MRREGATHAGGALARGDVVKVVGIRGWVRLHSPFTQGRDGWWGIDERGMVRPIDPTKVTKRKGDE